jgi:uncharacterized cupredoxin-like copper-binding protein
MSHTPLRITLLVAATLGLAACGGGGDPAGDQAGGDHGGHGAAETAYPAVEGAPDVALTAVDIDFEPGTLELTAGDPANVTVTNAGETEHDFTFEEADVHVNVDPGTSATTAVTVDEPGVYKAFCSVPGHADAGMVVEVTVAE